MTKVNSFAKKLSISKEYFFFAIILFIIIALALIWILFSNYQALNLKREYRYIHEGRRISLALNETFEYIDTFSNFLGKKIIQSNSDDPRNIYNILDTRVDPSNIKNENLTKSLFDFIDQNNYVIVESIGGVIKNPVKLNKNKRKWLDKVKENPWNLYFADPDLGVTSGEYIISAGYGLVNDKGKFIGTLSLGISIQKLTQKIYDYISKQETDFIVLNDDYKLITRSEKKGDLSNLNFLIETVKTQINHSKKEGFFLKPIIYNGAEYYYFTSLDLSNYKILIGQNINSLNEEFIRIIFPQIVKTILIGITFLILLYFFRSKVVNPMVVLSEKARLISRGKIDIELPQASSIESENLIEALELVKESFRSELKIKMQLAEANNEIKQMNTTLEKRVEERTEALNKALSAKTEFLNNMSHEVRTPIQGITAISQGLVEHWDKYDNNERKFFAKKVAENANRLVSLVSNLLDLSRITAGKMQFKISSINLLSLIEDMIMECKDLYIGDKNISLALLTDESEALIECDEARIIQVLRNLFANAIKFTTEGLVQAKIEKGIIGKNIMYKVSIIDNGVGIPSGEEESIFDPFIQSSRTKTKAGGTGLGLAICKTIIEGHNGIIRAFNNKEGKGATIEFTISAVFDRQSEDNIISDDEDEEIIFNNNAKTETPNYPSKKTILFIDDEETAHFSMNMMMAKSDYNLISAFGGEEGLEILRKQKDKIDIILLDVMMPDISGLNVLKEIRKDSLLKDMKVILQTGSNNEDELKQAILMGMEDKLIKPYNKQMVLNILEKAFK